MLYHQNYAALLLGCLMQNTTLLFNPSYPLARSDFDPEPMHRIIFGAIVKLAEAGAGTISEVEIDNFVKDYPDRYETLQDGNFMEFVNVVKELASLDTYELYYTTIRKFALLRELKANGYSITKYFDEMLDETEQNANLNKWSMQEILDDIELGQAKLRNKYDVNYVRDEMLAGEDTASLLDEFEERPAFGAFLQSPYLTQLYQGWCQGHLLLRSAPSGVGKSRMSVGDLCMVCAKELWDEANQEFIPNPNYQGPGFFIHTEMKTRKEINPMFLACISGVEYRTITNGLATPDEKNRILKAGDILLDSRIMLSDMPDFNKASVKRKIKELVEKEGCLYGVFDYVQLQSALASEYKETTNMPVREDLVLKDFVTDMKTWAEEFNVGILSGTQLNDNWKTASFPDEGCLSGAKSMKNKIDAGSIVLNTKERPKELKRIEPYLRKKGIGAESTLKPNVIEYMYKGRYSTFGDQKVKVWSHFDKGTFRRTDFFVTDANDQFIKVKKPIMEDF